MTLAERLVEAEAAYHQLMIGASAKVYVDQNGERVEYNTINRAALAAYIQELKRQINSTMPIGPLRVFL